MTDRHLPERQQALYDALKGKGDVPILELHAALWPEHVTDDRRQAQQALGPLISRANRRLKARGLRIRPGSLRASYTLAVIE